MYKVGDVLMTDDKHFIFIVRYILRNTIYGETLRRYDGHVSRFFTNCPLPIKPFIVDNNWQHSTSYSYTKIGEVTIPLEFIYHGGYIHENIIIDEEEEGYDDED